LVSLLIKPIAINDLRWPWTAVRLRIAQFRRDSTALCLSFYWHFVLLLLL